MSMSISCNHNEKKMKDITNSEYSVTVGGSFVKTTGDWQITCHYVPSLQWMVIIQKTFY